jgi:hypothetical protein
MIGYVRYLLPSKKHQLNFFSGIYFTQKKQKAYGNIINTHNYLTQKITAMPFIEFKLDKFFD